MSDESNTKTFKLGCGPMLLLWMLIGGSINAYVLTNKGARQAIGWEPPDGVTVGMPDRMLGQWVEKKTDGGTRDADAHPGSLTVLADGFMYERVYPYPDSDVTRGTPWATSANTVTIANFFERITDQPKGSLALSPDGRSLVVRMGDRNAHTFVRGSE
jgi:hypothetical protein